MISSHSTKEAWNQSEDAGAHLINRLMEFKDLAQQHAFVQFKASQFGRKYFTYPLGLFLSIIYVLYWLLAISQGLGAFDIAVCVFTFVVAVPLLWTVVALRQNPSALPSEQHPLAYCVLENAFMVSAAASVGLVVLLRTFHGPCEQMSFLGIWTCSPLFYCQGIPVETLLAVMFIPLLCCKTLPAISAKMVVLVYLFWFGIMLTSIIMVEAVFAVTWVITASAIVLVLHLISAHNQVQCFLFFQQTEALQRQHEEDVLRQAREMRNQIGQIAHDLRTPLVAFNYGLEVMRKSIDDLQSSQRCNSQGLNCALEGMEQAHMQLMMIVDRCMDYSKLTHGLALLPRFVPTHVGHMLETIKGYFKKIQDGVKVVVDRADVLGYVLTDQAWLQDNLLCLVSNAVRFSSLHSTVLLRIIRCTASATASAMEEGQQDVAEDEDENEEGGEGTAMLRFEVEDFGPGMEEDKVDDLFYAPDGRAARAEGGAGLGLYCLAQRIKALRGEYGVRCKNVSHAGGPATGTEPTGTPTGVAFWFTIPADIVSSSEGSEQSKAEHHTVPAVKKHGVHYMRSLIGSGWSRHTSKKCGPSLPPVSEHPMEHGDIENPPSPPAKHVYHVHPPPVHFVQATKPASKAVSKPVSKEDTFSALHILIVDDSPLILKMLKMMFLGKGHAVVTTTSGYEALAMLKACLDHRRGGGGINSDGSMMASLPPGFSPQYPFDVVFIDIQMPIIDGLDTMREYRKLLTSYETTAAKSGEGSVCTTGAVLGSTNGSASATNGSRTTGEMKDGYYGIRSPSVSPSPASLPLSVGQDSTTGTTGTSSLSSEPMIIAMSANSDHVTMQDAHAAGADHFLPKPFDLDTFYMVLGKHRKEQQRKAASSSSGHASKSPSDPCPSEDAYS